MNIVTSICIDPHDKSFNYQLYYLTNKEKREAYWKCSVVFFATIARTSPESNLILFTNDKDPVIINNRDIKQILKDLGVEIRIADNHFVPPKGFSNRLQYNLYKFEVTKHLANEKQPSILLDVDCCWNKVDPNLESTVKEGQVLLYSVYNKSDPHDRTPNKLSRNDQGELFKKIDPEYPVDFPLFYGGEIISGSRNTFKRIYNEFVDIYHNIIENFSVPPQFHNGRTVMDGNETLGNFIFNKIFYPDEVVNARKYIKRIWTMNNSTISPYDVEKTIWHMIFEKDKGIPLLFEQTLDPFSPFWKLPVNELSSYLGGYLGVPKRTQKFVHPKFYKTMWPRIIGRINVCKSKILLTSKKKPVLPSHQPNPAVKEVFH